MSKLKAYDAGKGAIGVLIELKHYPGHKEDEHKGPPKRLSLFASGENATTKGPVLFDDTAAANVMAAFSDMGHDKLPIDYGHGMLKPFGGPDSEKAAGWFVPSIDDDGSLVASDIEWTPAALQSLKDKEFRFFSPAITRDPDSGRALRLINLALTNLPATIGQQPMAMSEFDGMTLSALGDFIRARAKEREVSTEDLAKAAGIATATMQSIMSGDIERPPDRRLRGIARVLGVPMSRLVGLLPKGKKEEMSQQLYDQLNASDDAAAAIRIGSLLNTERALLSATGKTDPAEAITELSEIVKRNDAAVKLAADYAALQAKAEGERKAVLLSSLETEGKLTPALKGWAEAQTFDQLEAWGKNAPVVLGSSSANTGGSGGNDTVQLSAADEAMIAKYHLNRKDFIAQRKNGNVGHAGIKKD